MVSLVPENDFTVKFPVTEVTHSMEESSGLFAHMRAYIYPRVDGEEHMNSYANTPSISSWNHVGACKQSICAEKMIESHHHKKSHHH